MISDQKKPENALKKLCETSEAKSNWEEKKNENMVQRAFESKREIHQEKTLTRICSKQNEPQSRLTEVKITGKLS